MPYVYTVYMCGIFPIRLDYKKQTSLSERLTSLGITENKLRTPVIPSIR